MDFHTARGPRTSAPIFSGLSGHRFFARIAFLCVLCPFAVKMHLLNQEIEMQDARVLDTSMLGTNMPGSAASCALAVLTRAKAGA